MTPPSNTSISEARIEGAGDSVTVKTESPLSRNSVWLYVEYIVNIPRKASVDLKMANGLITINGLDGIHQASVATEPSTRRR
jgi:hypothetical protein